MLQDELNKIFGGTSVETKPNVPQTFQQKIDTIFEPPVPAPTEQENQGILSKIIGFFKPEEPETQLTLQQEAEKYQKEAESYKGIKGIVKAGEEMISGAISDTSKKLSSYFNDYVINKPAELYLKIGNNAQTYQKLTEIIDYGTVGGKDVSPFVDISVKTGAEITRKLAYGTQAISGLTGGIIKPETTAPQDIVDKIVSDFSYAIGTVTSLKYLSAGLFALGTKPVAIQNFIKSYPTLAKHALPFLSTIGAFNIYGQLSPEVSGVKERLKRMAFDTALAVPYSALGYVKQAKFSVPAAFGLGFGLTKLSGGTTEDALISGFVLGMLDASARAGGKGYQFIEGRKTEKILRNEAAGVLGVKPDADFETIKKARNEMAKIYHPDVGTKPDNQKMAQVNNAYEFMTGKSKSFQAKAEEELSKAKQKQAEEMGVRLIEQKPEIIEMAPEVPNRPGPAEIAAGRIERRLVGEERFRKTEKGTELLKQRLTKEQELAKRKTEEKLAEAIFAPPKKKPISEEIVKPKPAEIKPEKPKEVITPISEEIIVPRAEKVAKPPIVEEERPIHPTLLAMRKAILPEYNTDKEISSLDAFVDKIRELNPKDESDTIYIKDGYKYEATVSYPHSLGEMGNQTDFVYKEKPTIEQIKNDVLDLYKEFKTDINKPLGITGIVAKSGRDENIEKAIDRVLALKEKPVPEIREKRFIAKEVEVEGQKNLRIYDTQEKKFVGRFYRPKEKELLNEEIKKWEWTVSPERVKPTPEIAEVVPTETPGGIPIEYRPGKIVSPGGVFEVVEKGFVELNMDRLPIETDQKLREIKQNLETQLNDETKSEEFLEIVENQLDAVNAELEKRGLIDVKAMEEDWKDYKPVTDEDYEAGLEKEGDGEAKFDDNKQVFHTTKTDEYTPTAETKARVSAIEEPRSQLGYVINLIRAGKIVPENLRGIIDEYNTQSAQQIGEEVVKDLGNGKYELLISEEALTEEALDEFYPPVLYKDADPAKLQEGYGIEVGDFKKLDIVKFTTSQGEKMGLLKNIYDNGRAIVEMSAGEVEVDMWSLKKPSKLTKEQEKIKEGVFPEEKIGQKFELTTDFMQKKGIEPPPEKPAKVKKTPARNIQSKIFDIVKIATSKRLPMIEGIAILKNKIVATDLEFSVEYTASREIGEIVLPPDALKGKSIEEVMIEGMSGKVGGVEIKGTSIEEFPLIPEVKAKPQFRVISDRLIEGLNRTIKAVSSSEMRPELASILIKNEGNQLRVTATDSFRLYQFYIPAKIEADFETLLPGKSAEKLLRVLKLAKPEDAINVSIDDKFIQFQFGDFRIVSRITDGKFPEYEKILPKEIKNHITVSREELLNALNETPETKLNDITFNLDEKNNKINLSSKTDEITFNREIHADFKKPEKVSMNQNLYLVMQIKSEGKGRGIVFNKNYLKDFLKTSTAEQIDLFNVVQGTAPMLMREQSLGLGEFVREGALNYGENTLNELQKTPALRKSNVRLKLKESGFFYAKSFQIESANDVADIFSELKREAREKVFFLNLTKDDKVINASLISIGDVDSSMLNPSEAIKPALLSKAKKVYFIHNHPSGDTTPSEADLMSVARLKETFKSSGIEFAGGVIINHTEYGWIPKEGGGEVIKYTPRIPRLVIPTIPKELEPLAQEARKYKSAEEFVKAQENKSIPEILDDIINTKTAENQKYIRNAIRIVESELETGKYKVDTIQDLLDEIIGRNKFEYIRIAARTVENNLLTKPQLTKIYTQTTKGIKEVKPEKIPITEIEQIIQDENFVSENNQVRDPGAIARFFSETINSDVPTISLIGLDSRNKINGYQIVARAFRNITGIKKKITELVAKTNSGGIVIATNYQPNITAEIPIMEIQRYANLLGVDFVDAVFVQKDGTYKSYKAMNVVEQYYSRVSENIANYGEFTPEEQAVILAVQEGRPIPVELSDAVKSLQEKGVIQSARAKVPRAVKEKVPAEPMKPGEVIEKYGLRLRRLQQSVPRPYVLSYSTGILKRIKTFATLEEARRRFDAMADIRKMGREKRGILPEELQATKEQKAEAHIIAGQKDITDIQFAKFAKAYTGVDSMLKMTPEQADVFIEMLKKVKEKFGGGITIPKTKVLVTEEIAEREFKRVGLLDLFKTPSFTFRKIGVGKEIAPVFAGDKAKKEFIAQKVTEIKKWQKSLGVSESLMMLVKGKKRMTEQSERLFEAINNPEKDIKLSEKEAMVVDKARMMAKETADMVDEARQGMGLEPMNRRENYITNLLTDAAKFIIQETKTPPNELFAVLSERFPAGAFNRLLLQRKGGLPIKKDFWKALKAMVSIHGRYIHLSPPVRVFERFMRFYGDKIPFLSRVYMKGRLNRFLGRPGKIDTYLKGLDEAIVKALTHIPGLSKPVEVELQNGITEVLEIPKSFVPTRLATKALPFNKMLRYWVDLSGSLPFYAVNLTQFWINTIPKLRGNMIDVYRSAFAGYGQMLIDFFRPSKWDYWREQGVLTEMDNVIDNEFNAAGGRIGGLLNLFGKLSEFNNRVASALAATKNMELLARKGKFAQLYPELTDAFGEEAKTYARDISDMTQFRYGLTEKPVIFDNPIGDLYYQYNTFTIKQAEFVAEMLRNQRTRELLKDFKKAREQGKTKEFISDLPKGERGEFIRFLLNAAILAYPLALLGFGIFELVGKSMVPSFLEGLSDIATGLWDGDSDKIKGGVLKIAIPPSLQWVLNAKFPTPRAIKEVELIEMALEGGGELRTATGKPKEKLTEEQAVRRLFLGGRSPEQRLNQSGWDTFNSLQNKYDNMREEAMNLLADGKREKAREMVHEYNIKAKEKVQEMKTDYADITDLILQERIKAASKSLIVSTTDFSRWIKSVK